jgi:hypothetical protein
MKISWLTYPPGLINRMTTGMKYLWWHLSRENANRVLIEAEPAPPAHAISPAASQARKHHIS